MLELSRLNNNFESCRETCKVNIPSSAPPTYVFYSFAPISFIQSLSECNYSVAQYSGELSAREEHSRFSFSEYNWHRLLHKPPNKPQAIFNASTFTIPPEGIFFLRIGCLITLLTQIQLDLCKGTSLDAK